MDLVINMIIHTSDLDDTLEYVLHFLNWSF